MADDKFIITINREAGSGGREIAIRLAELLGVKIYGKEILASIMDKYRLTPEQIEKIMAEKPNWWAEFCRFYKTIRQCCRQHLRKLRGQFAAIVP